MTQLNYAQDSNSSAAVSAPKSSAHWHYWAFPYECCICGFMPLRLGLRTPGQSGHLETDVKPSLEIPCSRCYPDTHWEFIRAAFWEYGHIPVDEDPHKISRKTFEYRCRICKDQLWYKSYEKVVDGADEMREDPAPPKHQCPSCFPQHMWILRDGAEIVECESPTRDLLHITESENPILGWKAYEPNPDVNASPQWWRRVSWDAGSVFNGDSTHSPSDNIVPGLTRRHYERITNPDPPSPYSPTLAPGTDFSYSPLISAQSILNPQSPCFYLHSNHSSMELVLRTDESVLHCDRGDRTGRWFTNPDVHGPDSPTRMQWPTYEPWGGPLTSHPVSPQDIPRARRDSSPMVSPRSSPSALPPQASTSPQISSSTLEN